MNSTPGKDSRNRAKISRNNTRQGFKNTSSSKKPRTPARRIHEARQNTFQETPTREGFKNPAKISRNSTRQGFKNTSSHKKSRTLARRIHESRQNTVQETITALVPERIRWRLRPLRSSASSLRRDNADYSRCCPSSLSCCSPNRGAIPWEPFLVNRRRWSRRGRPVFLERGRAGYRISVISVMLLLS